MVTCDCTKLHHTSPKKKHTVLGEMHYPATHSDTRARVQLGASFMDDCTIQLADTRVILAA